MDHTKYRVGAGPSSEVLMQFIHMRYLGDVCDGDAEDPGDGVSPRICQE